MTEQKIAPVLSDDRAEFEAWALASKLCRQTTHHGIIWWDGVACRDAAWKAWQAVLARVGAVRDQPQIKRYYRGTDGMQQVESGDWVAYQDHVNAIRALKGTPAAACIGCGGPGWYTSHTTGYGHWVPCRHCNPGGKPVSQPSTNPGPLAAVERDLLAALIDIHDDFKNNPPESRCYVDSAFDETLAEARAAIAASKEGAAS